MLHPTILLIIIYVGSALKETHIMHLILFLSSMKNILKMATSRSKKEYSMILRVVELIEVVTIKLVIFNTSIKWGDTPNNIMHTG